MRALPDRERLILHMRFVEDMTQSQIAERIGISQMHVSRLIRKALEIVALRDARLEGERRHLLTPPRIRNRRSGPR